MDFSNEYKIYHLIFHKIVVLALRIQAIKKANNKVSMIQIIEINHLYHYTNLI